MVKKQKVLNQLKALSLLLIYLMGFTPIHLLHHHKTQVIVSFEDATACEKNIYFSDKDGHCEHQTHVTIAKEKCSLCDTHNIFTDHLIASAHFYWFSKSYSVERFNIVASAIFTGFGEFSNRGPPAMEKFYFI